MSAPVAERRAAADRDMVQVRRLRGVLWRVERGLPLPVEIDPATQISPMRLRFRNVDDLRWWLDAYGWDRMLMSSHEDGAAVVTAEVTAGDLERLDLAVVLLPQDASIGAVFHRRPVASLDEVRGLLRPAGSAVS